MSSSFSSSIFAAACAGDEAADLGENVGGSVGRVVEDLGTAHAVAHEEERYRGG